MKHYYFVNKDGLLLGVLHSIIEIDHPDFKLVEFGDIPSVLAITNKKLVNNKLEEAPSEIKENYDKSKVVLMSGDK